MPTLGVAIITKNAAAHLDACLTALAWADHIVLLDSGSTDQTLIIAEKHGVDIHTTQDWPGFGEQKNRALALLNTDWILALDSDEILSEALSTEIREELKNPRGNVYSLSRLSNYCGRWMRHSGWYPDRVARLFLRNTAHYSNDLVHERLIFSGKVIALKNELLHYSYDHLTEVLEKTNHYSSAGAAQRFARGQKSSLKKAIWHGFTTFIRGYIFRRGFLDGREGFILAISNAEGSYYRYLKLMYLNENKK